ncbi:hypothetical protein, partial [Amycolatopsis magusensis]
YVSGKIYITRDGNAVLSGNTVIEANKPYVLALKFAGDAANDEIKVNGVSDVKGNAGANTALSGVVWGSQAYGSNYLIAEGMEMAGLPTAQKEAAIVDELKAKYGVA